MLMTQINFQIFPGSVLQLGCGGLLTNLRLQRLGDMTAARVNCRGWRFGVEAVDDEQVAVGIVERGESGDARITGRESDHLTAVWA